jgi:PepSY-associated TM region
MLRVLVVTHRWLGIALAPLFAMWFASGIVMHFVPFPQLSESERLSGLPPLKLDGLVQAPADAIVALGMSDVRRVRLMQRADGPVYIISSASGATALRAVDLATAGVTSRPLALVIGADYARQRGIKAADSGKLALIDHDQWTVAERYQRYRPLYRLALDDAAGTEVYVSAKTGEVVLDTTQWERGWNFVGSVVHWIYPPKLRSQRALWSAILWWLSLAAFISVLAGVVLGVVRLKLGGKRGVSPFRGMHWWHHVLGLLTLIFVTTWIFSGWLSMDDGLLFSRARTSNAEIAAITGAPSWDRLTDEELRQINPSAREVEWFALGGKLFRREITAPTEQRLTEIGSAEPHRPFLPVRSVRPIALQLGSTCRDPIEVDRADHYAIASIIPDSLVYRIICGDVWYDIDAANGALSQKTDPSRRAYRWLYQALHTLDFPALMAHPMLRTVLVVSLCAMGLVFSLTGIVIGWRRLRDKIRPTLGHFGKYAPSPKGRGPR